MGGRLLVSWRCAGWHPEAATSYSFTSRDIYPCVSARLFLLGAVPEDTKWDASHEVLHKLWPSLRKPSEGHYVSRAQQVQ